jgi:hypothetical protein
LLVDFLGSKPLLIGVLLIMFTAVTKAKSLVVLPPYVTDFSKISPLASGTPEVVKLVVKLKALAGDWQTIMLTVAATVARAGNNLVLMAIT